MEVRAKIGLAPYLDGSGYEIEVSLEPDGSLKISSIGDTISITGFAEWEEIDKAVQRLRRVHLEAGNG